jgi:hypothetical protein
MEQVLVSADTQPFGTKLKIDNTDELYLVVDCPENPLVKLSTGHAYGAGDVEFHTKMFVVVEGTFVIKE